MSEEEIIKYAKVFSTATGSTHKIHFVNDNKTINEPDLWKETLNLIDKLQKENEELKEKYKNINWYFENQKDNFVHKDKIRNKIKELEENSSTVSVFEIDILKELLGE